MSILLYLVDTLLSLAEFAFLLRLLLQWARADFRNPLVRSLVQLTSPVLVPLRRLLPAIGRIDTASVLLVLALALARAAAAPLLAGIGLPPGAWWLRGALLQLAGMGLWTYFGAIFMYALLSMVQAGSYSPMLEVLEALSAPLLRPLRRHLPQPANLDLSPLWALILIQVLLRVLQMFAP
jgi:YggT family protein